MDDDGEEISVAVKSFRKLFARSRHPWGALARLLKHFVNYPEDGRKTLLKDGYLFADDPNAAFALVSQVELKHLFREDKIWVQRGPHTYHAERRPGKRYYYTDGPLRGEELLVLHLDRFGTGEPEDPPLHRDIRGLQYQLGFSKMNVRHITADYIVANLRYGNLWAPSVIRSDSATLELECEVISHSMKSMVDAFRASEARRRRAVQGLRNAMLEQIDEHLPFDEPKREYGHQWDGKLRTRWFNAYMRGRRSYDFQGERYRVFDREGRAQTPQVCIDFLVDTIERAAGSWWNVKGEKPGRTEGRFNFNQFDRAKIRRVQGFLDIARNHPEWFEVYDVPKDERIPLGERDELLEYLTDNSDRYRPGDIVMIQGYTPWDRHTRHYHSFYIYENDPITGMPVLIVGNAGRPTIRSWEVEARRTPKREIVHRIRPRIEWLERAIDISKTPAEPLPVAAAY